MIDLRQFKVWFVTGSQHLYGPETLKQVAADAEAVAPGAGPVGAHPGQRAVQAGGYNARGHPGSVPGGKRRAGLPGRDRLDAHLLAGLTRAEVVYGVTSLTVDAAPPTRLLELVQQHWGIENGLHYRRDVTFHEDAGRTQAWNLAQALAAINNLVLAVLLHAGHTNLAHARRHYAAHPDDALRLLLARPT